MGWEKARRGKVPYFTQSQRIDGKVKRKYIGSGKTGAEAAARQQSARQKRILEQQELGLLYLDQQVVDEAMGAYDTELERTFMAMMAQFGYHRHHRGEWRKRRQAK